MRIIVAPDKFKGSLPATQVAAAIADGLRSGDAGAEVVTIPVADGGEGTVDAASGAARDDHGPPGHRARPQTQASSTTATSPRRA